MEKSYLQWNIVNWITVTLMWAFGMIVVGAILSATRQYRRGNGE